MICNLHSEGPVEYTWTEKKDGRSTFNCPVCREVQRQRTLINHKLPRARFSQTWGRDRPLTDKERRVKPLKPT